MTQYSARDLRAANMLAMVLAGFGLAVAALGVTMPRVRWIPGGLALGAMGLSLKAKLSRIVRNGGYEDARAGKPVPSSAGPLDDCDSAPGRSMILVTSYSEAGDHPDNEDAIVVLRHPSGPDRWLCFLADGQGGQAGGAEAARLACRVAADAAVRRPIDALIDPDTWSLILGEADRTVRDAPDAGFTTLIGLLVTGGFVAGGSSGDSAVMMFCRDEPARELTRGQRKNPPVGSGEADVVPFSARLKRPWSILAMSDGVWKYVGWDRLVRAVQVSEGQPLVGDLQALARSPRTGRFPDDFTVVVFEDRG